MQDKVKGGIDTVHLWTLEPMNPNRLAKQTRHNNEGREFITGHFDNFRVSTSDRGTSLKGSLSRYHFGSNVFTLTNKDTENALDRLCTETGLDLWNDAKVNRLDWAIDIPTDFPVSQYLLTLGGSSSFKDVTDFKGKGRLYRQLANGKGKGRQLAFYDKARDAERKCEAIPEGFDSNKMLRIESRLFRPSEALGIKPLPTQSLISHEIRARIHGIALKDLQTIQMNNIPKIDLSAFQKPKDLEEIILAFGLHYLDEQTECLLKQLGSLGRMNASQVSKKRSRFRDLRSRYSWEDGSSFAAELLSKAC